MAQSVVPNWLDELLRQAMDRLDAIPADAPVVGIGERSVGCHVQADGSDLWLRVEAQQTWYASGPMWEGYGVAGLLPAEVRRPHLIKVVDWDSDDDLRVRAQLMSLAPGHPISTDMALDHPEQLRPEWWSTLRDSLDSLAAHQTDRVCIDSEMLTNWLRAFFEAPIDLSPVAWTTAHGDLHWANLTSPECSILDWESWGTAPAGYDAAQLYCTSLLQPSIARSVHAIFADILDSPAGQIAQLAAIAKLLIQVQYGRLHNLAPVLHRQAAQILDNIENT